MSSGGKKKISAPRGIDVVVATHNIIILTVVFLRFRQKKKNIDAPEKTENMLDTFWTNFIS